MYIYSNKWCNFQSKYKERHTENNAEQFCFQKNIKRERERERYKLPNFAAERSN